MWYDLTPAKYAEGLLWNAQRCDESAAYKRTEGRPWSEGEAQRSERNAKRLRAMAMLCAISTAERVGNVDFLDMDNPAQTREAEAAAIAKAEAMHAAATA